MNTVQDQAPITPLAIWALILGIASLVCGCLPLAIPAIICGHLARSRIAQTLEAASGSGMAMAGLIMGYVSVVAFILICILGIIAALTIPAVIKLWDDTQRNACRENPVQFQCFSCLSRPLVRQRVPPKRLRVGGSFSDGGSF